MFCVGAGGSKDEPLARAAKEARVRVAKASMVELRKVVDRGWGALMKEEKRVSGGKGNGGRR